MFNCIYLQIKITFRAYENVYNKWFDIKKGVAVFIPALQ